MSFLGVMIGIVGIFLLVSQKQIINQENSVLGMAMIFMCMVSWAYASLFVAKADLPANYFVNTGIQMFTAGMRMMLGRLVIVGVWAWPKEWSNPGRTAPLFFILFERIIGL